MSHDFSIEELLEYVQQAEEKAQGAIEAASYYQEELEKQQENAKRQIEAIADSQEKLDRKDAESLSRQESLTAKAEVLRRLAMQIRARPGSNNEKLSREILRTVDDLSGQKESDEQAKTVTRKKIVCLRCASESVTRSDKWNLTNLYMKLTGWTLYRCQTCDYGFFSRVRKSPGIKS